MFKQPQPKGIAHLSMAKDERGVDVISDQEKGKNSILFYFIKNCIQEAEEDFSLHKSIWYSSLTSQI